MTSSAAPLLMIPGPIEYHPDVMRTYGLPTVGHLSGAFMSDFSSALQLTRTVFQAHTAQPLIVAGSGTLGWEIIAANLLEADQHALVVNTGYFSDSFADCLSTFGVVTHTLQALPGDTVQPEKIAEFLKANPNIAMVCLTHVDTSTAVRNDIAAMCSAIRSVSSALIAVDGVCSFGGEQFNMEQWGVDAAMTCSQKALGAPPGLCICAFSSRALERLTTRRTKVPIYFGNLNKWLPIMRAYESKQPSYFATPPVNAIRAYNTALRLIVDGGLDARVSLHARVATAFRAALSALGLQLLAQPALAANTLSAIYFPTGNGVDASKIIPTLLQHGVVVAGGLHKDLKTRYFRVGHMGYSCERGDLIKVVAALEEALIAANHSFTKGAGIQAFEAAIKQ